MTIPSPSWKADNLRLTVFLSEPVDLVESPLWHDIVGSDPDKSKTSRSEGYIEDSGSFDGGTLILRRTIHRIDWYLRPILPVDAPPSEIPSIGSFNEKSAEFQKTLTSWLGTEDKIKRIAFGAQLFVPVSSRKAGYRSLNNFVPIDLLHGKIADFSYKINRPRKSRTEIDALEINRLCTWSVAEFVVHLLSMESAGKDSAASDKRYYAYRLELDINTSQYFPGLIPSDKAGDLLAELISLGQELVEKGDCE